MKKQKSKYLEIVLYTLIVISVFLFGYVMFSDFVPSLREQKAYAANSLEGEFPASGFVIEQTKQSLPKTPSTGSSQTIPQPNEAKTQAVEQCVKENPKPNENNPKPEKPCQDPKSQKSANNSSSINKPRPTPQRPEDKLESATNNQGIISSVEKALKNILN